MYIYWSVRICVYAYAYVCISPPCPIVNLPQLPHSLSPPPPPPVVNLLPPIAP